MIRSKEVHTNAVILESLADIPDAEIKPPENVLFVCKLNPVTQDEDLYTIFSRFGTVTSAEIIRDYKTGFIGVFEFETKEACERAYFKMDNCLIDDRRIHVDFSQSVSKLWGQFRQSKRNAKKDGCFKCGAPDRLARDCYQDDDQKNKGPNYVLKDENAQRGGNHCRIMATRKSLDIISYFDTPLSFDSYDLVFDEDDADYSDKKDDENGHRRKIQRNDDRRSELPPCGDRDRNNRERTYSDEKGSSVVKTMIGSEGVENMMTTTVTVDLVIKALVDTMIVIIASAIAGAGAERMRTNRGINRMVSGAIEMMDMKRVIITGEMKSTTGKGAQKVDVGKTVGTVRETSTLMMDPIRRGGTEMVDRFPYNCRFCVACFPLMSTCITRSNFSVNQCNDLSYVEFL